MNLKILILCIIATATAVTATSHKHHLRHEPGQHDISFRATKGRLHRLLNDNEVAPNRHLEALRVLRGSQRSLKKCEDNLGNEWRCNIDTEECGDDQDKCDEVCNEKKDCHGNGKCDKGECKCYEGYEEDEDCGSRDIEYIVSVSPDDNRSADCTAALNSLVQNLDLPSTMSVDTKSKRSSNKSEKGPLEISINLMPSPNCNEAELVEKALIEVTVASGRLIDGDGDQEPLPAPYECLAKEAKDTLKKVKDEKDAKNLEGDLNKLLSPSVCDVVGVDVVSCVEECHHDIEKVCKDEVDPDEEDEDDCGDLDKKLVKCYKECFDL